MFKRPSPLLLPPQVMLTKIVKPEANVIFEWTSQDIPARGYTSLELTWTPPVEWATREVIQFTDNRNFKKDVAVVLKSVDKSKLKVLPKKPVAKKAPVVTRKLVIKSPSPRTKQRARVAAATLKDAKRTITLLASIENRSPVHNTGAIPKRPPSDTVIRPSAQYAHQEHINGYNGHYEMPQPFDAKENRPPPPVTPPKGSSIFDDLQFTPVSNRKVCKNGMDYLASLPTPTSQSRNTTRREHGVNLTASPLDLSPNCRPMDLTTTMNVISPTPQTHHQSPVRPYAEYPLHLQQTPVIVYNRQNEYTMAASNISARLSTTFDKSPSSTSRSPVGRISPFSHHLAPPGYVADHDHTSVVNRTRIMSPAPDAGQLYVIAEEEQSESMYDQANGTYIAAAYTQHERTYNVEPAIDNLIRDINLISSPLRKKFLSMKDLSAGSNMSLEQQILRNNQGSMPNLHKLDRVKSIENNRYFYHSIDKDMQTSDAMAEEEAAAAAGTRAHTDMYASNTSMCSMQSATSLLSVAFQETEILAQSSRFNINEIGRPRSTATVVSGSHPTSTSFFIASNDALPSLTAEASKPFAANISPVFTKPKMMVRPTKKVTIAEHRSSVISSTGDLDSLTMKRTRDDPVHSSLKSLKESPPKRLRSIDGTPSPRLPRGQSFRIKTWAECQPKKFPVPKGPMQRLVLKKKEEERVILYDPDLHLQGNIGNSTIINDVCCWYIFLVVVVVLFVFFA